MPDTFNVEILIGGSLKKDDIKKLARVAANLDLSAEYGETSLSEARWLEYIQNEEYTLVDTDDRQACALRMINNELPWGDTAVLEKLCQKLGLTYQVTQEGKYEWPQDLTAWRPGLPQPLCYICDGQGIPVLSVFQIQELLATDKLHGELGQMQIACAAVPPLIVV